MRICVLHSSVVEKQGPAASHQPDHTPPDESSNRRRRRCLGRPHPQVQVRQRLPKNRHTVSILLRAGTIENLRNAAAIFVHVVVFVVVAAAPLVSGVRRDGSARCSFLRLSILLER
jgi:hypothetical protein